HWAWSNYRESVGSWQTRLGRSAGRRRRWRGHSGRRRRRSHLVFDRDLVLLIGFDRPQPRDVPLVLLVGFSEDMAAGAIGDEIQFARARRVSSRFQRSPRVIGNGPGG